MYVCCPSRLKKTLFAIEANRCRFWQRSEEAKRSVRRTKILSSYYILPYLNFLEAKNKEGFFSFLLKKDDGNIIILIYHDIKELLLQFSNNEQSPGAHISNKKWVNDIAEATGNIKFARISTHTPAIYIRGYENIKVCRYPGANISNKKWINDIADATGNLKFARISVHTPAIYIIGYKDIKVCQCPGAYISNKKWGTTL